MPFVSPYANLHVMLLNDRAVRPWILLEKLSFDSEITGERYEPHKNFMTNLVSMPKLLIQIPIIGNLLFFKYFGNGVWLGARESVLHDWLMDQPEIPNKIKHLIFREALYCAGYDPELCESYYKAVSVAHP